MKKVFTLSLLLAFVYSMNGQLQVTASEDQFLCQSQSVTLTATAPAVPSTSAYSVSNITWAPEVIGGTTVTLTDDSQMGPVPIGFSFCFLGSTYTQFFIGSNGWISFTGGQPTTYTSGPVPSTGASVPKNCIMGPWQDWHPGIAPANFIKYQTIGTAPFRKLVVTYDNVPMFSCTSVLGRFQIVCHETTNVVENHIFSKQFCSWGGGTATQAIHNATGTIAYAIPGRNSTVWTATNESWRYTPSGPPGNIVWTVNGGNVGTGTSITVTPTSTTTYVASLNQCGAAVLPDNVVVTVAPSLQLPSATISPSSCNTPTGAIVLNINPNVPGPFNYSWNDPNSSTGPSISNLGGGQYAVQVTDLSNDCVYQQSFTVQIESTLELAPSPGTTNCFNGQDGTASVIATSDFPGYSYEWNDPQQQTTEVATGLPAGSYTVVVTDGDGCVGEQTVVVTQPTVINVSTPLVDNVSCSGANDGSVVAVANGGTPGYTFNWSNGSEENSASNLAPGDYTVTVTDTNGCTREQVVTITGPEALVVDFDFLNVSCNGEADGQATANPTGGTGPFTFDWPQLGVQTQSVSNLGPGAYTVNITDANDCTISSEILIENSVELLIEPIVQDITCNGLANGTVTINVSGGNPEYTYNWNDPNAQTTQTAVNLDAGDYTVLVTDATGCEGEVSVSIIDPAPLTASVASSSDALCFGQASGQASVNVNGGTQPYTLLYNGASQNNPTSILQAGSYTIEVVDASGCTVSTSVEIGEPGPITSNVNGINPLCFGGTNGSASVAAGGGVGGFTFVWTNSASTSSTASNLSSGSYAVTVTDGNGCSVTSTVTLTQPTAVVASVSSSPATCGLADGSATAAGSGGNGPYTFSWQAIGQQTAVAGNLEAGSYQVIVTDANGCTGTSSVVVAETNFPNASIGLNIVEGYSPLNVTFSNTSTNATQYIWNFGDGTSVTTTNLQNVNHTFTSGEEVEEFEIMVVAVNAGGCADTTYVSVLVFGLAELIAYNVFTPNGDGKNDIFRFSTSSIEDFECIIFNRWGAEVYRWNDQESGWTGRASSGDDCPSGTYFYVVRAKGYDGAAYDQEGNLTLIRE